MNQEDIIAALEEKERRDRQAKAQASWEAFVFVLAIFMGFGGGLWILIILDWLTN